jgi:hypothetical protein
VIFFRPPVGAIKGNNVVTTLNCMRANPFAKRDNVKCDIVMS